MAVMYTSTNGALPGDSFYDRHSYAAPAGKPLPPMREGVTDYFVPTSTPMWTAQQQPGWRSMDLRHVTPGQQILAMTGEVWQVVQHPGYLQKDWEQVGDALPGGWVWAPDAGAFDETVRARWGGLGEGTSTVLPWPTGSRVTVLEARPEQLALLMTCWQQIGAAAAAAFYEDLAVQLHRPAPQRRGLMKLVKHPTRRGAVAMTNVDPMTPWALRAASERLVGDLSLDLDHQTDDVNLKRYSNLHSRHQDLQRQLDEVAGHLTAAEALLRADNRVRQP